MAKITDWLTIDRCERNVYSGFLLALFFVECLTINQYIRPCLHCINPHLRQPKAFVLLWHCSRCDENSRFLGRTCSNAIHRPDGSIDFKIDTDMVTNGYVLKVNYHELPEGVVDWDWMLVDLKTANYYKDGYFTFSLSLKKESSNRKCFKCLFDRRR